MTSHQQTVVNQLRQEYARVIVLPSKVPSFFVDCFNGHATFPTKTYKVSPSGFKQDISQQWLGS